MKKASLNLFPQNRLPTIQLRLYAAPLYLEISQRFKKKQ